MKLHRNAKTCPNSRLLIVERVCEQGWTIASAAEAAGVSKRTVSKWLARYRVGGVGALSDSSSAPKVIPHRTSDDRVRVITALRRLRMTAAEIAGCLGMALSTVSAVLTRIGLGKRSRLEPLEPLVRYERGRPGELLHIDVKKLGRIAHAGHRVTGNRRGAAKGIGWEYVHVCVDDATRLAYVEVLEDEKAVTAVGFLRRAVAYYQARGITVERVMTDNGSCYLSTLHAAVCQALQITHKRTRPYRPQTNGKAERFIRTMLNGWAYAAIYGNSTERRAALPAWLDHYNHHRPHSALSHQPPSQRLEALTRNNLARSYS